MTTHIIRIRCDLPAIYRRIVGERRDADLDYAMHAHLRGVFGEFAPQPFRIIETTARDALVLGYADHEAAVLEREALSFGWSELASKPMPRLRAGRTVGFELRACPTRRGRHSGPHPKRNPGVREIDAFLAEAWRVGPEKRVDREAVYRGWLGERLERGGAAELIHADLQRFRRLRTLRRTQGERRRSTLLERPDALLSGLLRVTDSEAFAERLRRGVGRHRAFGFGMLLLRAVA